MLDELLLYSFLFHLCHSSSTCTDFNEHVLLRMEIEAVATQNLHANKPAAGWDLFLATLF